MPHSPDLVGRQLLAVGPRRTRTKSVQARLLDALVRSRGRVRAAGPRGHGTRCGQFQRVEADTGSVFSARLRGQPGPAAADREYRPGFRRRSEVSQRSAISARPRPWRRENLWRGRLVDMTPTASSPLSRRPIPGCSARARHPQLYQSAGRFSVKKLGKKTDRDHPGADRLGPRRRKDLCRAGEGQWREDRRG